MKHIVESNRFKKDLKRQIRRGKNRENLIHTVLLIAQGKMLPSSTRPHKLSGEWAGLWECHIESDWLLIYDVSDTYILLVRTGTHADLFKM